MANMDRPGRTHGRRPPAGQLHRSSLRRGKVPRAKRRAGIAHHCMMVRDKSLT